MDSMLTKQLSNSNTWDTYNKDMLGRVSSGNLEQGATGGRQKELIKGV